ncbi:MAG: GntR family transcriptional regulator [Spirochaetaceae bacterium]|nr:MAG: GntR family transcriptional regulator [Spirochaetaceae bacterium]
MSSAVRSRKVGRVPMPAVKKANGVPLYAQIREALRRQISAGELKPGTKLPGEDALTEQFGVSRMTVRQGVSELIDEGLLYRRRGVGTFVSQRHVQRDHNRLTTFFDSAAAEGFDARIEVLAQEVVPAKHMVAQALDLKEGEPVIYIRSLRFADGLPITLHDEYVPYKLFPELLYQEMTTMMSWEALERSGYRVKHAVQKVEALPAEHNIATVLQMEKGAPILFKHRTVIAEDGNPLEFALCYSRGDSYALTMTLKR